MKIYSQWTIDNYPETMKIVDWQLDDEICDSKTYSLRLRQQNDPDNWFRNLELISTETKPDKKRYGDTSWVVYHILYERKQEYFMFEIEDTIDALTEFMKIISDTSYVLEYQNDRFQLNIMDY